MKRFVFIILALCSLGLVAMYTGYSLPFQQKTWKLNTSNLGKLQEFRQLFLKHNIELSSTFYDLTEIDADPVLVAAHKASQVDEYTLIEDTCLDIEDANVGINVRWVLDNIEDYAGKKAVWRVLLAYRVGDMVHLYQGEVNGTIVPSNGRSGFGFDPVFLPEGATHTLAESKPDIYNARSYAVEALLQNKPYQSIPAIYYWDGAWQQENE